MSASTARPSWPVLLGALLLVVAAVPGVSAAGDAVRSLSATSASCGGQLHVTVELSPPEGTDSWLAEEVVPDGWAVSNASGGLSQTTDTGVKFTGSGDSGVTLSYDLDVPDDAAGDFAVTGEHRFHPSMDDRAATSGTESVSVTCDGGSSGSGSGSSDSSGSDAASRTLPSTAACGDTFTVAVELSPPEGTDSWLAEEVVPDGWAVSNASGGLSQTTDTGVKFTGSGDGAVTLTYDVSAPDDAAGDFAVTGEHRFHPSMDDRAATSGDATVSVGCSTGSGSGSTGASASAGADRSLPGQATCGDTFAVDLVVTPADGSDSWLAEEVVPDGWSVVDSSGALSTQTDTGVKFTGSGDAQTSITYTVSVPSGATGDAQITGEHRFSPSMDARADNGGDQTISVDCASGPAVRSAPSAADAGETVTVTVQLTPPDGTDSWLVEETTPDGVTVSNASGGLSQLTDTGVKFTGSGDAPVTLTYDVSVPEDRDAPVDLSGEYRFHPSMDDRSPIVGDQSISVNAPSAGDAVSPPSWAQPFDEDADCVFQDGELFTLIGTWIATSPGQGPSDDDLFAGIMAWKQAPGSYC